MMIDFVTFCRETADNSFTYVPLDIGNFEDCSSFGRCICIRRCTSFTRSVMAADLHGLLLCFVNSIYIQEMVNCIMGRQMDIDAMIASQSIFNVISRLCSTTEKRLTIDVFAWHEAHRIGELFSLFRIRSSENVPHPLTKSPFQVTNALRLLMKSNTVIAQYTGGYLRKLSFAFEVVRMSAIRWSLSAIEHCSTWMLHTLRDSDKFHYLRLIRVHHRYFYFAVFCNLCLSRI